MNWYAAGLKRGPYILRIARRTQTPIRRPLRPLPTARRLLPAPSLAAAARLPCHPSTHPLPAAAESLSLPITHLPLVSGCLFDAMRPKDPPSSPPRVCHPAPQQAACGPQLADGHSLAVLSFLSCPVMPCPVPAVTATVRAVGPRRCCHLFSALPCHPPGHAPPSASRRSRRNDMNMTKPAIARRR